VTRVSARFGARTAFAAGGAYLGVSLLFFGRPVLPHLGRDIVGSGSDPQIFVWSFAWWPHAILHGHNPIVSHALWAPVGSDLAWTGSAPGLALLLAPVTLAAGPVAAYNVASILLPALAAWTAFLLCRHLTDAFWPSLAGGYLFGFSSYLLGHELGHLHLTSVFLVPLAALVVLRFVEGEIGARGLVLRLGPLLALQFAFSTEVFFTLALALGVALVIGALAVPARRVMLGRALPPLAASYALSLVLVSPLVWYALTDFHSGEITPTGRTPADLVTFAFPNRMTALGGRWWQHFDPALPAVSAENGQYVGLPALLIVGLFAWRQRARPAARFLVLVLAAAVIATLGSELQVRGHRLVPLPWRAVRDLPLFDNVIPGRLSLYVSLAVSVVVALWAAGRRPSPAVRLALVGLAVLAIVPNLRLDDLWSMRPARPSFFASELYKTCVRPDDNVLVLPPPSRNQALLWQAEAGFRFRIADAGLSGDVPANLPERPVALELLGNDVPPHGARDVLALARAQGVTAILVDAQGGAQWTSLLRTTLRGRAVGGIVVYRIGLGLPSCRHA
jgi:hypothetical protein